MRQSLASLFSILILTLIVASCSLMEPDSYGREGQKCYADDTCDAGFHCDANHVCRTDETDGDETPDGDTDPDEERPITDGDGEENASDGDMDNNDVNGDTDDDVDDDPGEGESEEIPQECQDFAIAALTVSGGKTHLVYGEEAFLTAEVPDDAENLVYIVEPASMEPYFTDQGSGNGLFSVTNEGEIVRAETVTITLKAGRGDCTATKSVVLHVLGDILAADSDSSTVEIFRSNGAHLRRAAGSTYLSGATSLIELPGNRFGVGSLYEIGVEVFDLEGNHQFSFDTEDEHGADLYGPGYGVTALVHHRPDGRIWATGPRGKLLAYDTEGNYLESIVIANELYLPDYVPQDMIQLPDNTTVTVGANTWVWELYVYSENGTYIGGWGDNEDSIKLRVKSLAVNADGNVLASGKVGIPVNKGHVVLLSAAGILQKQSDPLADFDPESGAMAFGTGWLVCTSTDNIAHFDKDLNLVTASWAGTRNGRYRDLLMLGADD